MSIRHSSYTPDSSDAPFCIPLLLIPDSENEKDPIYGINPGLYDRNGLVELLRTHCMNPDAIQYIADMLEE
jgi:hypothetical protein